MQAISQNFKYKLASDHCLMTSYIHFNETQNKLLTCGQQGQLNMYQISAVDNKIQKLAFINLFEDEAVTCVAWAKEHASSRIAVAGSKGTLLILKVDLKTGHTIIQKQLKQKVYSLEWLEKGFKLLVGTRDGRCLTIMNSFGQWNKQTQDKLNIDYPVAVTGGFGTRGNNKSHILRIIGCKQNLYLIDIEKDHTSILSKIYSFNNENIIALLCRNQGLLGYTQILILTNKNLYVIQYKCVQLKPVKHQCTILQQIDVSKQNYDKMYWGWSQSQIGLYSNKIKNNKDEKQGEAVTMLSTPAVFKRKFNGFWVKQE